MSRADSVELTASTTSGDATISDETANGTAELSERRGAVGDSVTFRKDVDDPQAVEVRIVATASRESHESQLFDRTVTL